MKKRKSWRRGTSHLAMNQADLPAAIFFCSQGSILRNFRAIATRGCGSRKDAKAQKVTVRALVTVDSIAVMKCVQPITVPELKTNGVKMAGN